MTHLPDALHKGTLKKSLRFWISNQVQYILDVMTDKQDWHITYCYCWRSTDDRHYVPTIQICTELWLPNHFSTVIIVLWISSYIILLHKPHSHCPWCIRFSSSVPHRGIDTFQIYYLSICSKVMYIQTPCNSNDTHHVHLLRHQFQIGMPKIVYIPEGHPQSYLVFSEVHKYSYKVGLCASLMVLMGSLDTWWMT